MAAERLQKILAQAGYGSRRACEDIIRAGRVTVNGKIAVLGSKADPSRDLIAIDGRKVQAPEPLTYIALNKPRGVVSTVVGQDERPTVTDLIATNIRLYPVGRLDADSEGLILLMNDGNLANKLTHPRYEQEKEYHVLVARKPDDEQLNAWRRGVVLEDGYKTAPARVSRMGSAGKGAWLRIVMKEGRKRQIRETGRQIGLPVSKLIRVRIGTLKLGNLKSGEWRYLTKEEVLSLQDKPKSSSSKHKNRSKNK